MGRLLGLMLFCIGIGMVIGMLVTENVIIIISAGLCLLCGYHMFCRWYYFYFSGSQTRSTYIHLLCTASSGFNSNGFHVRFPHFIRSSMWMTYIISEISTFFTNCAFSHDSTSLTLFFNSRQLQAVRIRIWKAIWMKTVSKLRILMKSCWQRMTREMNLAMPLP